MSEPVPSLCFRHFIPMCGLFYRRLSVGIEVSTSGCGGVFLRHVVCVAWRWMLCFHGGDVGLYFAIASPCFMRNYFMFYDLICFDLSKLVMVLVEYSYPGKFRRARNWHIDVNGSLQLILRTIFSGIASPRAVLFNFGMASPRFFF